ncbi:hypothetical protein Ahy_A04g017556 isoform A [Arachis hypogaea]|uniref:40S ribosomal protein n=1 Tax=Arachis hypogaea TaxID=3818 RepID=A0A445DBF3_ARAHY|nr:hypothetical protein Ahy_A04g017556 isoform A [Arachis hypogaea]
MENGVRGNGEKLAMNDGNYKGGTLVLTVCGFGFDDSNEKGRKHQRHELVRPKIVNTSPIMELPEWTDLVKTARFKELAPYDPDWYFIRAASMARKIYLRGGLGVGAFKRIYGGSQRNGSRPPHFCESSGAIARHILQQLESMTIIEVDPKGGRRITSNGRRDLDQVAGRIVVAP